MIILIAIFVFNICETVSLRVSGSDFHCLPFVDVLKCLPLLGPMAEYFTEETLNAPPKGKQLAISFFFFIKLQKF